MYKWSSFITTSFNNVSNTPLAISVLVEIPLDTVLGTVAPSGVVKVIGVVVAFVPVFVDSGFETADDCDGFEELPCMELI